VELRSGVGVPEEEGSGANEPTPVHEGGAMMQGVAALRAKIGEDWPYKRWSTWNEYASRDAIRHFAFGFGDDNPLWSDPEYASSSRWQGIIAPPTFIDTAGITPKLSPSQRKRGSSATLAKLNMFWIGDRIRYFAVVREGDRIEVRRFYTEVSERESREFGRTIRATRRRVYKNQNNELIAIWDAEYALAEHSESKSDPKGARPVGQITYSQAELDELDAFYAAENIRGSLPRFVEDLKIGEELERRVKGPLTLSDMIAFLQGSGRHEIYPYRLGYRNRQKFPKSFYPKNTFGAFEPVIRGHWDQEYARSTGLSGPYDFGAQRIAWMSQIVTDWMGDSGVIVEITDRLERFTTLGDLTRVTGVVSDISFAGEWPTVTCRVECRNQRDEVTARSDISVRLPSRSSGTAPDFPVGPEDGGLFPGMPTEEGITA
jgi:acyl dehydratase